MICSRCYNYNITGRSHILTAYIIIFTHALNSSWFPRYFLFVTIMSITCVNRCCSFSSLCSNGFVYNDRGWLHSWPVFIIIFIIVLVIHFYFRFTTTMYKTYVYILCDTAILSFTFYLILIYGITSTANYVHRHIY